MESKKKKKLAQYGAIIITIWTRRRFPEIDAKDSGVVVPEKYLCCRLRLRTRFVTADSSGLVMGGMKFTLPT